MIDGDTGFQDDGLQYKFVTYLRLLQPEIVTDTEMDIFTAAGIDS
jgi:hypothetical protein